MFDLRAENTAVREGILDRMESLEHDLTAIPGVRDIVFDLDNYEDFPYVILIPAYDLDVRLENYYEKRHEQLAAILAVCAEHDLHPTGDRIEDYGERWYIVRRCGKSWPSRNNRKGGAA